MWTMSANTHILVLVILLCDLTHEMFAIACIYHHTLTVSLHDLLKYKFMKIAIITINTYALRRQYCQTEWAKKLSSKLLFISSANIDGFY